MNKRAINKDNDRAIGLNITQESGLLSRTALCESGPYSATTWRNYSAILPSGHPLSWCTKYN